MKLPREAKDAVQPRRPRTGAAWRAAAIAMLAMGREVKPRRRPRGSADVVAPSPAFTHFAPARRQNTRVHLQGAPQRLAAKRPHLGALSGATRCWTGVHHQASKTLW